MLEDQLFLIPKIERTECQNNSKTKKHKQLAKIKDLATTSISISSVKLEEMADFENNNNNNKFNNANYPNANNNTRNNENQNNNNENHEYPYMHLTKFSELSKKKNKCL